MNERSSLALCTEVVTPLVSVVLPVYNGGIFLPAAVDSILAQTFDNFELILIDDGSTDDSLQILRKYEQQDRRVRLFSRANKGLPATLNEAVDLARGQFIARMDQDDISHPNRLAVQYEYLLTHQDVVVVGSAATFMDANGEPVCTYHPPVDDATLRNFFPNSPFIHPSVMFRKEEFNRVGKYSERMKWGGEDLILFGRFARLGLLHNLPESLINYRLVPGSMSRKPPGFRIALTKILASEIAGQPVTESQLSALQLEIRKIDRSAAHFDYYFELSKLCIWSGGSKRKVFKYLNKCAWSRYSFLKMAFMYILASMPAVFVTPIYYWLKRRRYDPCTKL